MFDNNRRKYPRVNYPCQLTLWPVGGNQETVLANTSNVGVGGLCVHLNEELTLGMKVDIQLYFPNMSTPFKCQGIVVRCTEGSDRFYEIGIQFEALSELKFNFLNEKIAELIDLEKKGKS